MAETENSKKADKPWQFKPGKSGNPGGRPKEDCAVRALAREKSTRAVQILAEIMENSRSDTARILAANSILDRAVGKPAQEIQHSGKDGEPGIVVEYKSAFADPVVREHARAMYDRISAIEGTDN